MDDKNLTEKKKRLENKLKILYSSKTESEFIAEHMKVVHEYNKVKDAVQTLIGGLATIEKVTVKEIHERLNLPLTD